LHSKLQPFLQIDLLLLCPLWRRKNS
jgi:hypothetical protein